jgi:hypothetical protein
MVGDRSILDRRLRRRLGHGADAEVRELARAIDARTGCESLALIAWTAHLNLASNHREHSSPVR